jgi:uncharacterized protein involved in exopolysaccharide biosynthesis/Mrp family chromosome partitioning ATPase
MPASNHISPERPFGPPAGPDWSAASEAPENPWRDAAALLGQKIRANVWAILLAALVCAGLAGAAKMVLPPSYKASAQILIDPHDTRPFELDVQPTSLDANAAINYVESQMGVIGSERVLLRVIREQGLAGFSAPPATPGGTQAALQTTPEDSQESFEMRRARELAENKALLKLQKAVGIGRAERSFLVNITVTDPSPERAASLANALVKAYGEVNTVDRNTAARRMAAELNTRVEAARRNLSDTEAKLQSYKIDHNLVGVNDKTITERRVTEATDALTQAENKEALARARLKQLESAPFDVGGVASFGPDPESRQLQVMLEGRAVARSELENQESNFGDRHPVVIAGRARLHEFDRRITAALDGLRRSTRAQIAEAQSQTGAMQRKLADIAVHFSHARESDVALREMEENLEAKRKALTALEGKQREANDLSRLEGASFRSVSPARIPNVQGETTVLALWVVFGAFIGVALAISILAARAIFEEAGLSSPAVSAPFAPAPLGGGESFEVGGMPILAALPMIAGAGNRHAPAPFAAMSEAATRPQSPYSAAVQALLLRLMRTAAVRPDAPLSVLIAGAQPRAGASTLAVNLARIAAARGERVLLIDANGARPALEQALPAVGPRTLIELAGKKRPLFRLAPFAQSLSVLPALDDEERWCAEIASEGGYRPISGLNGNFDLVIFDGPDARQNAALRALFPVVDSIVLVAPPDATEAVEISYLLRRLGVPAEKFLGFVRGAVAPMYAAA